MFAITCSDFVEIVMCLRNLNKSVSNKVFIGFETSDNKCLADAAPSAVPPSILGAFDIPLVELVC